ncbi:MAG: hypothetical protein ACT4TC_09820 [Myxococcaceae bacterium]
MTIPKDVEGLFAWFLENDPTFVGESDAAVAAHFLRMGLQQAYEAGLRNAEPMEADEFAPLAASQVAAFNAAGE